MIQDIYPHIYHNEYTPHEPNPEDIVLHYKDNTVFVKKEEQTISFLKFSICFLLIRFLIILSLNFQKLFFQTITLKIIVFSVLHDQKTSPLPESPDGSYLHGTVNTNSVENAVLQ